MIPSTTNRLLVTEDWTKIYQSFKNADFKSYDFETLRRTMITYLKERYPEDFNDYIESSEYIALIDLIAFLGQNLSFRIDLNARENFLETAERRESILKLARLISYNAARNTPASGLLKVTNISTSDSVIDSNGVNLSNTVVTWNDVTNPNWYSQFVQVLNSAMPGVDVFGKPSDRATVDGILTEQYKINSTNTDVPVYSFYKSVGGTNMVFEAVSAGISSSTITEEPPMPGRQYGVIYRNDNHGTASSNTGFFIHFKQGTLSLSSFSVDNPVPNELIGINAPNINDTDVWLWQMNSSGTYETLWEKVSSLSGNNIIYNSVSKNIRTMYAVLTREQDQIDLSFADGSFGDLPRGEFKLFYRQSNGLTYTVKPEAMNGIALQIPYRNKAGQAHQLTLTLGLQYAVTNATGSESDENIKLKAPQTYYTQNRMITGEDYNIAPLSVASDVLKLKAVNRVSSGISKYFELSDVSGKYSKTNIFATDGVLYQDILNNSFSFAFTSRNDALAIVKQQVGPVMRQPGFRNFYISQYPRRSLFQNQLEWNLINRATNKSGGFFSTQIGDTPGPTTIGTYGGVDYRQLVPGTLVKFVAPVKNNAPQYFLPTGKLTTISDSTTREYIWARIVSVTLDGANGGAGGTAAVILSANIPSTALVSEIIPKFTTSLAYGFEADLVARILSTKNFGLSYDQATMSWYVISEANLNTIGGFSLANQRSVDNLGHDASWMILFSWDGRKYTVKYRNTSYVFESERETAFFVDPTDVNYDFENNRVVKDCITVLGINRSPMSATTQSLGLDYQWQIDSAVVEPDGYINPKKVQVSFFDANGDGQIDDPDAFVRVVAPASVSPQTGFTDKFVYFLNTGTSIDPVLVHDIQFEAYPVGSLPPQPNTDTLYNFFTTSTSAIKSWSATTADYTLRPEYSAKVGRSGLKFQYVHNSGENRRLDPSKMNLIELYILSKTYDAEYRAWLASSTMTEPLPPTAQSLSSLYSPKLNQIKSISDEVVFHAAKYRVLFGGKAETNLQAVFKAVRNPARSASDNDMRGRIFSAINDFFSIDHWEFGQSFYFGELAAFVMNRLTPDITNFVLVPRVQGSFGDLFEISCLPNEIFVSGASTTDIEIVTTISQSELL